MKLHYFYYFFIIVFIFIWSYKYCSSINNISIYTTNSNTLRIAGLSQEKTNVKLFTILGKQVLNTSFSSNGIKDVYLSNLSAGIYVVQLETSTRQLNKKITLE